MNKTKNQMLSFISKIRDECKLETDVGIIEIDLNENKITWANQYVLDRIGYTLEQLRKLTLFEIIPDTFHKQMRDTLIEVSSKKSGKVEYPVSVWPMNTYIGNVVWWSVVKFVTDDPMVWVYGDHIQTTTKSGMPFLFMQAFMKTTNKQNDIQNKVFELKNWTTDQITNLEQDNKKIKDSLANLESKMDDAIVTSKEVSSTIQYTNKMIETLQKSFTEFEARSAAEILKLIGTDAVHDKRIDAWEKHVKMTTDLALKSIEIQAQRSAQGILNQAEESSKGLSKKVIIPVSLIATVATIIQVVLEKFF